MKQQKWPIFLGLFLIVLSAAIFCVHYLIFHDVHHIFIYLLGDIAFVPIEVLLVTLILHQLLAYRDRKSRLEKMNMVIGTFFSEIGTRLLVLFSDFDPKLEYIKRDLIVTNRWTDKEFVRVEKKMRGYDYNVEISKVDFEHLRNLMLEKKEFLIRLLENPNLLEHENFTNILWGIFHLAEELTARRKIKELPQTDLEHMAGDIKRFYGQLVYQWLDYMKHLKDNYPYLFSLAMRTNPFDESASAEVHS